MVVTSKDLTVKEIEAIRFIRNSIVHNGRFPSIRELGNALGYKSPRSAQDILLSLQQGGIIDKQKLGRYRLILDPQFSSAHAQTVDVPIVGTVACGSPIFAEENIEGYIPIATSIAKTGGKYFLLHAKGDSMNEAGIKDGELVLVRQQTTAKEGDRVLALIDDEATIKEFHRANDVVILKPRSDNPAHKPIILDSEFQIQGVVVAVIPDLK